MKSVSLCFQVHQPYRLKSFPFFSIGNEHDYFDDAFNKTIFNKIANNCYLPTNALLLKLIKENNAEFRIAFSITGTFIEQCKKYNPKLLDSFIELSKTNAVEFIAETTHHTLSYFFNKEEFTEQLMNHHKLIHQTFGYKTQVFRNTELLHNNAIASIIKDLNFKGIITEGIPSIIKNKSTNQLFTPSHIEIPCLLRNLKWSDDIAFRFSDKNWSGYPLTAEKLSNWVQKSVKKNEHATLYVDYETFGEHHAMDTGIYDLLKNIPSTFLNKDIQFLSPSEAIDYYPIDDVYDAHHTISWADTEKDVSAWYMNPMQKEAIEKLYSYGAVLTKIKNASLLETWRKLQTSDHFYYMSTKGYTDGKVHQYFSPYKTPYDAYLNYMNVLSDFELEINKRKLKVI